MSGRRQVRGLIFAVSAVLAAAAGSLPATAVAHGAGAHEAEDSVFHDVADEPRLESFTSQATAADAASAAAAVSGDAGEVGSWGPVVDWPVVAVHAALLPNGKVLAYDSVGDRSADTYPVHDHTRATLWDPATGTQTPVDVLTGHNIFCSGLAHLPDGSIFVAGGNLDARLDGIVQTHTFDPTTNTWSVGPDMEGARWYPSVTPLRDGETLITSGGPQIPEARTTSGALRALNSAALDLANYPWVDVAPDGRAFVSGPDPTMYSLDPAGGGAWQTLGQRDPLSRDYGSRALYDVGKILVTGGGRSSADARVIDINGETPSVTATAPMASGRRQHNLTVLADGSVLATGGNSSGSQFVDLAHGVYPAERWNPATGAWKTLAPMQVTRQYHSTALLLPDGRVLSAGGGICGACDTVGYLGKNAEVFSPPYLFQHDGSGAPARRPVIESAPRDAGYAAPFAITTPDAASIRKLALVRLGAVTHSVNMEQRYVPLSFTAGRGTLKAKTPPNANVAPPGVYMLFAIDAHGVPSVAKMVTLAGSGPPVVAITRPERGTSAVAPATLGLAASASDADGSVAKVEFFNGSTKLGEDTTAPYGFKWAGVPKGSYTLTARATDDLGTVGRSAVRTVTVTLPNRPPTARITSPPDGALITPRPRLTITATASDPEGRLRKVEFFRADGATKLGEDITPPYSFVWSNPPAGSDRLRVRATDIGGATGLSPPVTIRVR
jgi:WD40 repeat protein